MAVRGAPGRGTSRAVRIFSSAEESDGLEMNHRLSTACILSLLIAGAGVPALARGSCPQPPEYAAKLNKHGNGHWRDDRLIVFSHDGESWSLPEGWEPVGAERVRAACASFPRGQAAVMVRRDRFQFRPITLSPLGMRAVRVAPLEMDPAHLTTVDAMIVSTFEAVARLYPLGLRPKERTDHSVLVTVNLAGDGIEPETRLYPSTGPNLSVIFYNLYDPRGRELFIHTTTHLFNRHRARRAAEPDEKLLPRVDYQELVASWAELALIDDERRQVRFEFLLQNYRAVVDGDAATTPTNTLLAPLSTWEGPIGLVQDEPLTFELVEFRHYVLGPLLMLAVDGLLERSGTTPRLWELLREVHAGKHRGLLAALAKHLSPQDVGTVRDWISGVPVPENLARAGLTRLR